MTLGANENISLEQLHTSGTSPGGSRRTSLDSNINRAENTGTGRLPEGNGDGEDGDGHDLDEIDIHSIHDFDRKASGGPSGRRNSDFGQNFKKPQAEVVIQHNTLGSQTSTSTDRDSSDGGQLQCVANISFTEALLKEKPQKWTKTMFKLYFFLGVAFINSVINGYDASVMGGINTMETYKKWV